MYMKGGHSMHMAKAAHHAKHAAMHAEKASKHAMMAKKMKAPMMKGAVKK